MRKGWPGTTAVLVCADVDDGLVDVVWTAGLSELSVVAGGGAVCVGTTVGYSVCGGAATTGSVLVGGAKVSGWFTGSAVVVVTGCCVSREIAGTG